MVQSYGYVPTVSNTRCTDDPEVTAMLLGAPDPWKITLCATLPNAHVTVPPWAMVLVAGENVLASVVWTVADDAAVTGALTVTSVPAVAVTPSRVSDVVITAAPGATAMSAPLASTSTLVRSLVVNVAPVVPAMGLPRPSRAVTVMEPVAPIARVAEPTVAVTCANRWATVTAIVLVTPPLVAVMVAPPLPTAVTVAVVPVPATVATPASLVLQVTTAPDRFAPLASATEAVSARVSPRLTSAPLEAAVMLMLAGTGGGVVAPSPPAHAAARPATTRAQRRAACETVDGIPTSPAE